MNSITDTQPKTIKKLIKKLIKHGAIGAIVAVNKHDPKKTLIFGYTSPRTAIATLNDALEFTEIKFDESDDCEPDFEEIFEDFCEAANLTESEETEKAETSKAE